MNQSRVTAIDLFSGVGGMSLGFEQAGFDVRAAFDLESWNTDTYQRNFPSTTVIRADLKYLDGASIRKHAELGKSKIDVIFGGPPCQGFSVGGTRDLDDERNLLINEFARLVNELSPSYFVMENVKGLLLSYAKPALDRFLKKVRGYGYRVLKPTALNAAQFGVPQERERTFIIGYRPNVAEPQYPVPRPLTNEAGEEYHPTVRDAISDLPAIEKYQYLFTDDRYRGKLGKGSHYSKLMRGEVKDSEDRSSIRSALAEGLTGCLRTLHSSTSAQRFAATKQGKPEPISRYFRLSNDGRAPTIRAGTGPDHGSHTAPRPIHPTAPRCITIREAARLHSFPDWFQFFGTRWHAFRQIGNSVPPFLARAVARQIMIAIQSSNSTLGTKRHVDNTNLSRADEGILRKHADSRHRSSRRYSRSA